MTEIQSVPVPETLKQLILTSNILLQNYQQELTQKIQIANAEMMGLLGLDPQHGWILNTEKMTYTKQEQTQTE